MRDVTEQMIKDFKITKLKYDFMGYQTNLQDLSFHHLIVPRRNCRALGFGDGYLYWNGAILNQSTSHEYLHVIEMYNYDMFLAITSELIDINISKKINISNLKNIHDILKNFEREYCCFEKSNGHPLIKEAYTRRMIKLWLNILISSVYLPILDKLNFLW